MRVLARFVKSAVEAKQFPAPALPEIAFLGRSNVGKSSVINTLVGAKIAKTSSTPGRTRMINFFEVRLAGKPRPEMLFVDLPGYGYAKLSREVSAEWPKFIDPYLTEREPLALCISLVDANIAPQESDRKLFEFLRAAGRPFLVVGTKADKLSGNQLANQMKKLSEGLGVERIIPFSAKGGQGRDELWREIRQACDAPAATVD
jgi:GTP-binding protein